MIREIFGALMMTCAIASYAAGPANNPILVLGTTANYGTYIDEILKAEGFNGFQIEDLADKKVNAKYLNKFDLVILSQTMLNAKQAALFTEYVTKGGCLIAIRPDTQLAPVFGISYTGKVLTEGYLTVKEDSAVGKGLITASMRIHGSADQCRLAGGSAAAVFDTLGPAVVTNTFGKGHAVAFTYELPRSIVLTRQGNPAWAMRNTDLFPNGIRPCDLFFDPESGEYWNDAGKASIPQADEQMRLLSHAIEWCGSFKKPLPRFWYFPSGLTTVAVWTGDEDWGGREAVDDEFKTVNSFGPIAGYASHASIYYLGRDATKEDVNKWRAQGNEVGVHVDNTANSLKPTWATAVATAKRDYRSFDSLYGVQVTSTRHHWLVWCGEDSSGKLDFCAQAKVEESFGVKMDYNYYNLGHEANMTQGGRGFSNGSGLAMRFADATGQILNIYQTDTHVPDEAWAIPNGGFPDEAYSVVQTMVENSKNGWAPAWVICNFHPHTWHWWNHKSVALKVLQYCKDQGVPVFSGADHYNFINMKNQSSFEAVSYKRGLLSFVLRVPANGYGSPTLMLPNTYDNAAIKSITLDNKPQQFSVMTFKGNDYALAVVSGGTDAKVVVEYASQP